MIKGLGGVTYGLGLEGPVLYALALRLALTTSLIRTRVRAFDMRQLRRRRQTHHHKQFPRRRRSPSPDVLHAPVHCPPVSGLKQQRRRAIRITTTTTT